MKNRIIIFLILLLTSTGYCLDKKPILVISSTLYDAYNNKGLIYPEIAVDQNGKWREATKNDLWIGQQFSAFTKLNHEIKDLNKQITIKSNIQLPAEFTFNNNLIGEKRFYCTYSKLTKFKNQGMGKTIKPKPMNIEAERVLKKFIKGRIEKDKLQHIVDLDYKNIIKDFPELTSRNVNDYMIGDINGDKINDYVFILGENTFGNAGSGAAAVICYICVVGDYKRIPIQFYKRTSDETGWPQLLFIKDFNGDKAGEVFIAYADSDTSIPIVYSWFGDGLRLLFQGNRELWNG